MKTADIPVIELRGSARERGRSYGEEAKSLIAEVVTNWRTDLGNFGQNSLTAIKINSDSYLHDFLKATHYYKSIELWTPHLLEEVKGIAEGSGQAFESILGLNFMDEEWIYGLQQRLNKPSNKCTAFGIPNQYDDVSYGGQNMDIGSWVEGRQVLLRVMPHEVTYFNDETYLAPEALVFSNAGNIALNGVNANGLGITCNTLAQLNHSTTGLPISFIVRSALEQPNIDQAERFLRSIQHASGQNFILSSHDDMRCFECSSSSVVRYAPTEYSGRVFHSNHPIVNQDFDSIAKLTQHRHENSEARMNSICTRLGDPQTKLTLNDIKAALAAHDDPDNPVSRNVNNEGSSIGFTAGSSIYEFSDITRLHLAAGPPCETDFEIFEFTTLQV